MSTSLEVEGCGKRSTDIFRTLASLDVFTVDGCVTQGKSSPPQASQDLILYILFWATLTMNYWTCWSEISGTCPVNLTMDEELKTKMIGRPGSEQRWGKWVQCNARGTASDYGSYWVPDLSTYEFRFLEMVMFKANKIALWASVSLWAAQFQPYLQLSFSLSQLRSMAANTEQFIWRNFLNAIQIRMLVYLKSIIKPLNRHLQGFLSQDKQ